MESLAVDLNHLELLAVKGEDSGKFLQGQLTCNVPDAGENKGLWGAICNNKGRVLGSFLLLRIGQDHYLEMRPGMLAANKANLDKYIVFYKARTSAAQDEFRRLGVMGKAAEDLLLAHFPTLPQAPGDIVVQERGRLIRISPASSLLPRYELWLEPAWRELPEQIANALPAAPLARWELEDLRQGLYHAGPADSGEHTPQVLNYDLAGLINFKKGCYTGQEIVARMHYRGSARKRLYPVLLQAEESPALPCPVLDASGARTGEALRLLDTPEGKLEGLAILDSEKAEAAADLRLEGYPNTLKVLPQDRFSYSL